MRLSLGILAIVTGLAAAPQPAAGQSELKPILIGKAASSRTPELTEEELGTLSGKPLHVVIDTPYEIWSGMGSYVHVAVYDDRFAPASGALVYMNHEAVGITDWRGTLVFRNQPRADSAEADNYKIVTAIKGSGKSRAMGRVDFESYPRTASFESAQLFVYADRGVYNPGQPILLRVIAWRLRGDYEPIAGQPLNITLLDHRGRMAGGGQIITNDFGTGGFKIPLPQSMPEGNYELVVQFEGARERTRLRVERVVPPAIEIEHDLPRFMAKDQTTLPFVVRLDSFTGAPPRSGELSAKLVLQGKTYFAKTVSITGAESYAFEVPPKTLAMAKRRMTDRTEFRMNLTATDASGRTDTVKRDIVFAINPYTAVLEADKDQYVVGESVKLQLKLIDLDGAPVRGKSIRLDLLGAKDPKPQKTNDGGIALFAFAMPADGVEARAYVSDVKDALATTTLEAIDKKPMLSKVKVPVVRERRSVPIEVTIEPGYVPTESYLHGDIVDASGALVSAFMIPIKKSGQGYVASGNFTAPSWGTMLLTLFCAARDTREEELGPGLLTEGQQITVEPDKALKITLSGVPKTARPGQEITVRGRVLDPAGRGRTASVGAAVIDSAVLSLLDPLEIKPGDRYYNPELKVLSTTGSKILTWPVVSRSWGPMRMDIALPPFGYLEGDFPEVAANERMGAGRGAMGAVGGAVGYGSAMGAGKAPAKSLKSIAGDALEDDFDLGGAAPAPEMSRAAPGAPSRREPAPGGAAHPPPPVITLRTSFPQTALWLDDIRADRGSFSFSVTLPDSITRQAVSIVASDDRGGVGTFRSEIPVRQTVFARSDLPAVLQIGESTPVQAAVQNLGEKDIDATLTLSGADLEITGDATITVRVPAQSAVGHRFMVEPKRVGTIQYEVRAKSAGYDDTERKTLRVTPPGSPQSTIYSGNTSREKPFTVNVNADYRSTFMARVTLPFVGPAAEAFKDLSMHTYAFYEAPGSQAVTAYHLATFFEKQGLLDAHRAHTLRDVIAADLVLLSVSRDRDGGYRFIRSGKTSPYLTARAIEGLVAARETNFPVRAEDIGAAGRALLRWVDKDGLIPVDDISWWEGKGPDRQLALTAQAFRVLAEAGPDAVPDEVLSNFERMREKVKTAINLTSDPLTIANAGLGLIAYHQNHLGTQIDYPIAKRLFRRIMEERREAHWEPSWFNAAGGTLQSTAAAVELVNLLDPETAAPLIEESYQVLLKSRALFGTWHNGPGTAAMARALAALPPTLESQRSSVSIYVGDKEVFKQSVDPKNPFAAATALALIDLTDHIPEGERDITVKYSGVTKPYVSIIEQQYNYGTGIGAAITAKRDTDKTMLTLGDAVVVTLDVRAKSPMRNIAIEEPVSGLLQPDRESLDALVEAGRIAHYEINDRLVMYVPELRSLKLVYRLQPHRTGKATLAAPIIRPVQRPEEAMVAGGVTHLQIR